MNITKKELQTILDTLKDMSNFEQKPIRDALMITSEDAWHNLVHSNLEEFVDVANDDYTWHREDDLKGAGYIHEDDLMEQAVNDIEGLCDQLAKEKEPQTIIAIELLNKLYIADEGTSKITKDEYKLIEAILEENGYDS